jgi:hypothetical protein
MRITIALKKWAIANCGVEADAGDDDFKKAIGNALVEGDLTTEKYAELSKDKAADEANQFSQKLDRMADGLEKMVTLLTPKAEEKKAEEKTETKVVETKTVETQTKAQPSRLTKLFTGGSSVEDGPEIDVRVKEAAERYSMTKSAMVYPAQTKSGNGHPFAGQPVRDFSDSSRLLDNPSERDKAVVGAYGQFMCDAARKRSKNMAWASLPQHQKELILYAMENMEWGGASDGGDYADIKNERLSPIMQKAIIDDSTSGGTEAVPIVFDDMIVSTPILHGEFFPLVNTVPLDKGRRIQGARAGIVGSEWGGVDDTSVTLFNTAAYVSAFDTTIFRWQGSIWIGLDFLSDTPIDFAMFLTNQYGEVLLRDLDSVICTGDGTTQPEGVMTKSGTTSATWSGSTTLGNYESLMYGVHRRELLPNMMRTVVFGGTWVSYQRAKAIPVGANDARRLSQTITMPDYYGYSWMGQPYKVNESLTNSQIFYAVLGRYRMYRRRGLIIRNSVEGDTLIRRNEMLLVAMARYGGQLERSACACITSDAPA